MMRWLEATGLHFHAPDINSTIIARLIPEGARLVENTHVSRNREFRMLHNDFIEQQRQFVLLFTLVCYSIIHERSLQNELKRMMME